jgi:hypothetical protein
MSYRRARWQRANGVADDPDDGDPRLRSVEVVSKKDWAGRCLVSGKVRFTSQATAGRRAVEIMQSGKARTNGFKIYRCPHCGGFHFAGQKRAVLELL